jgi:2-dehydro-3-deoxyphosphooctonate aldolase (KDO 8-P synthase)
MTKQKKIKFNNFEVSNNLPLTVIAGPCQMESRQHALECAEYVTSACSKLGINLIYKSSFDKANRSSISGKRGIGLKNALPIFEEIKNKFNCPVLTDVHSEEQCAEVAKVVDVLQIPAFLCRQTDLLLAAGKTNRIINIKKGQFLAPWDMKNVAAKIASTGNENIMLTDRGFTFGYNRLISDMRALPVMAETGYPVVFDATHSVQEPGGQGESSGGQRQFVKTLARAAASVGIAVLFIETHNDPDNAPSDGPCMIPFNDLESFLAEIKEFDKLSKKYNNYG